MGVEPPFIYDRPNSWNFAGPTDRSFNPKAVTHASWTPKPAIPKKDGPLIDFNKHPDSYLIVPYGNLTSKPMHPNTRMRVKNGRRFQLFLRISGLLAALGLLFCCIAINKTSGAVSWIIRIAPAVALLQNVHGVYHLCRAATGRTPASTASYMLFAAIVDTALLPFFAFAAYVSYLDWSQNRYGWSTLFNDTEMSYKIIFVFFVLSSAEGGIVFFSLIMDIYLATIFRKIAKMPPDMNPLEPNLTSRHGQKHKRNKSSMNVTEKHMSSSTLANQRDSGVSGRRIPFIHTRTDSADSVTLYGNQSARNSRIEMRKGLDEAEKDPYRLSNNSSRVTLAPTRPTSAINPAENARTAGAGLDYRPARSSALATPRSPNKSPERPSSWLSYLDYEGVPSALSDTASEQLDQEVRPISPVSALSSRGPSIDQGRQAQNNERENWYNGSALNSKAHLSTFDLSSTVSGSLAPPEYQHLKKRSREPLGMNPPTPTVTHLHTYQDENVYTPAHSHPYGALETTREALTPTHANAQRGSRPSSFVGSGGKSRFYGDLRASMGGNVDVIGQGRKASEVVNVVQIYDDHEDDDGFEGGRKNTVKSMGSSDYSGNVEVLGSESEDEDYYGNGYNKGYNQRQEYDPYAHTPAPGYQGAGTGVNVNVHQASPITANSTHATWNGARQTSNSTGHDLSGGYAGLGAEFGRGMARRREVSGKVAEEGRGHGVYEDVRQVTVEEEITPKKGLGASGKGWARFKGL